MRIYVNEKEKMVAICTDLEPNPGGAFRECEPNEITVRISDKAKYELVRHEIVPLFEEIFGEEEGRKFATKYRFEGLYEIVGAIILPIRVARKEASRIIGFYKALKKQTAKASQTDFFRKGVETA